jgi:uncharacterized protein DUF4041/T5orf172 domain-containing protein
MSALEIALLLLTGVLVLLLAILEWKRRVLDASLRAVKAESAVATAELQSLSRFRAIVDAEAQAAAVRAAGERHAAEIVANARSSAAIVEAESRVIKDRATLLAQEERARATRDAQEAERNAQAVTAAASEEAAAIVSKARAEAERVAGDALKAHEQAREMEEAAAAFTNVIEGYGDRYVVPSSSFLDDLADEFGFAEAGQKLKEAREHSRELVRSGNAATCDYVEQNRKDTAIRFVLDAFNGKVDSILTDVRHDNGGTLERRIRDAFTLVNHNGEAFRRARIRPEYLDARLAELRWAVVANELKLKEREEQRALKERIREEEIAQREFERAAREAENEEEMLRKAMEKVRKDVERANDEQKAKFEQQLAELSEKLRAAEEKNQRALSMAQQTKAGHVYVISNVGSFGENVYKIGLTRRLEPLDRVRELGDASVPFPFDIHALIRCEDAPALERALQKKFVQGQMNKVNPRKEFFRAMIHEIRVAAEQMGCQATWTIAAECREYKETLAIERAIKEGKPDATKLIRASFKEDLSVPPGPAAIFSDPPPARSEVG